MEHSADRNDLESLAATREVSRSASADSRVAAAMEVYLAKLEAGEVPVRGEFLARFPEIADKLEGHLEGLEFLYGIAPHATDPHSEAISTGGDTLLARASLGDFRLIRQIGRGGMGVVYEAEQLSLGRRVAVKVLPFAAMLDEQHRKRFYNEARAAATLDHPHIVPVHFVGQERGVHFFAMHLIDGQSLAEVIEGLRTKLPQPTVLRDGKDVNGPRQRPSAHKLETVANFHSKYSTQRTDERGKFFRTAARFGAEAAEALEHAHQIGILHRDIKPGNLLIDAAGKLWVADFGLAIMEQEETLTRTGGVLGTAAYMSPEQAADSHRIDGRSDVYSLGATLYELLTLRRYRGDDLTRPEANRNPNFNLPSLRSVDSTIPLDLETIVIKALSGDPADRYQTARDMADDLRSFIDGREIKARRLTFLQRQARWLRRHRRLTTGTIAASFLLIAAFAVAMSVHSRQLSDHAQRLETALADAADSRREAMHQKSLAEQRLERSEQSEQRAKESELHARHMSYRGDTQRAYDYFAQGDLVGALRSLSKQVPTEAMTDLRGIEWRLLNAELTPKSRPLGSHDGPATECVLYPDESQIATAGEDGFVHLWKIDSRQKIKSFEPKIGPIHAMALSPDGKTLAIGGRPILATLGSAVVYLLDSETGQRKGTLQRHKTAIESIRFSPNGELIAAGARYQDVKVSTVSGKHLQTFVNDERNENMAFSPDSQCLAILWEKQNEIRIWNCQTGEQVGDPIEFPVPIASVNWSSVGGYIVVSGKSEAAMSVFDAETGKRLAIPQFPMQHSHAAVVVAISSDGKTITAGDTEGKLHRWQPFSDRWKVDEGEKKKVYRPNPSSDPLVIDNERFTSIVPLADGSVVTTHFGGNVILTNPQPTGARVQSFDFDVSAVAIAADGSIYFGSFDGAIYRFDIDTEQTTLILKRADLIISDLAFSGDSKHLVVVQQSSKVEMIELDSGESIWTASCELDDEDPFYKVAVSHDARYLACIGGDNQLVFWDVEQNRQIFRRQTTSAGRSIDLSPNGQWIAYGSEGTEVLEFPSGKIRHQFRDNGIRVVRFSPDGRHCFRGTSDGNIRLFDFEQGTDRFLRGPAGGVHSVAFSRDGRTFVTTDRVERHTIRVWDTETGEPYGMIENPIGATKNTNAQSRTEVFVVDNKVILCSVRLPRSKIAVWDLPAE